MRLGIDLMGGDSPPQILFPAVLESARQLTAEVSLLVFATKAFVDDFSSLVASAYIPQKSAHIEFQVVADTIGMSENPLDAVRRKKGSSMLMAMRMLKDKKLDALVSCGNTGALIAGAVLSLPLLAGVSRPALLVPLPTKKGPVAVLDVGGNVACKAQQLVQFGFLGAAYQRAVQSIEVPTVGLLNIGVESKKGTAELRQAFETLQMQCQDLVARGLAPRMHFVGNVEARDVFKGSIDVLVTDGFAGNILLKTAEGVAAFIFDVLQPSVQTCGSVEFQAAFSDVEKQFNYAEYPGALVCGVDGVVVKVHGNATADALRISILGAAECVQKRVITLLKQTLNG